MSWDWGNDDLDFEVKYDFESDVDMEFDTDVDFKSDIDVDTDIDVKVDIDGNTAAFNVDVQAFGDDTAVEVNLVSFTSEDYSSITLTGYSATG